jgi:transcriptional regulator with GAF, ATPase, and Fis domain
VPEDLVPEFLAKIPRALKAGGTRDGMTVFFEKAMAGLNTVLLASACRMNRLPPGDMGVEIENVLGEIGKALDADRASVSAFAPGGHRWETVFSCAAFDACPSMGDFPSAFPSILNRIGGGEALFLGRLPEDLPPGADPERERVVADGLQSVLAIPITTDGAVSHLLTLFYFRKDLLDPLGAPAVIQPFADFIASACVRHHRALEQEKLARFEAFLDEISSTYINIPVDDIDRTVTRDLERLCRLLDADRYNIRILSESRNDASRMLFSYTAGPEDTPGQYEAEESWLVEQGGHDLFRHITEHYLGGEPHAFSDIEELPDSEKDLKAVMYRLGVKSHLTVPISVNREVIGMMIILTKNRRRTWPDALVRKIRQFGDLFANAYVRKRSEEARKRSHEEIERLKARLESDYRYLSDEFKKTVGDEIVVGGTLAMNRVMEQVMQVAPTQSPVLLLGETGTGKGVLALALHQASRRAGRPLVQLNCATLVHGLIESELFGHERGAFTGADRKRTGRFEIADGASIFLDEIGELPLGLQAKLLRVLETGEFERLGGDKTLRTDARIIAATNRDIEKEAAAGRFRKDLWYRLSIFPIHIPPLRERSEDIPALVEGFVERFSQHSGKHFNPIPQGVMDALKEYPWPGNVRELRNLIERAVIVSPGGELRFAIPDSPSDSECLAAPDGVRPFSEMERAYLLRALEQAGWRVEGAGGAADLLALNPSTLRSRMRKLGIRKTVARFE